MQTAPALARRSAVYTVLYYGLLEHYPIIESIIAIISPRYEVHTVYCTWYAPRSGAPAQLMGPLLHTEMVRKALSLLQVCKTESTQETFLLCTV